MSLRFTVTLPLGQSAEEVRMLLGWLNDGGYTDGVIHADSVSGVVFVAYGNEDG